MDFSSIGEEIEAATRVVIDYMPNLLTAALIAVVAFAVAKAAGFLSRKAIEATPVGRKAKDDAARSRRPVLTLGHSLGSAVFWVVFLLFIPAFLNALGFEESLEPLESMLASIWAFLPNVLGAILIVLVGWLIAAVARRAVTGILAAAPIDRAADRVGLGDVINGLAVARAAGIIIFALILIPAAIAGLDQLDIRSVSEPSAQILQDMLDAIPRLIAAALILFVAYLIGQGVRSILLALLMSIGFDRIWSALETDTRKAAEEATPEALVEQKDYSDDPESAIAEYSGAEAGPPSPSHIVANIVLVAIVIFGAVQAAEILNFAIISAWLARVLEIGGNILFGASIILVGLFIARFVAALVAESGGPRAELTATVTRYGVSLLAVVIGLTQMGLGDNIVRWGFLIVLAGISLAFGIAFGVGGREAAARFLKKLQDGSDKA